jgi:hypothetical protein
MLRDFITDSLPSADHQLRPTCTAREALNRGPEPRERRASPRDCPTARFDSQRALPCGEYGAAAGLSEPSPTPITIYLIVKGFRPSPILDDTRYTEFAALHPLATGDPDDGNPQVAYIALATGFLMIAGLALLGGIEARVPPRRRNRLGDETKRPRERAAAEESDDAEEREDA